MALTQQVGSWPSVVAFIMGEPVPPPSLVSTSSLDDGVPLGRPESLHERDSYRVEPRGPTSMGRSSAGCFDACPEQWSNGRETLGDNEFGTEAIRAILPADLGIAGLNAQRTSLQDRLVYTRPPPGLAFQ